MTEAGYTIGQVARAAGVNVETVRFYHRRGLLPLPGRAYGAVRRYGEESLARLRFIRRAQRLGFTLDEVAALRKQLMSLVRRCRTQRGKVHCPLIDALNEN